MDSDYEASVARIEQAAKGKQCIIDGAQLLDEARAFLKRFCAFPSDHALAAVSLWAAHAHMVAHFHTTPRLALLSPEPASGKTRVLEVLDLLVPESMFTLNASPAAIFRTLEERQITLLFDEVDAIWSKHGKADNHEDLRALLNAGYKKGATIPRCTGPKHEVKIFSVFCAVALAGLGDLPDTVMSRAVIIRMRRRAPHEKVEEFRTRKHAHQGHALRDRLSIWADQVGAMCGDAWPALPPGVEDRPAEIWEPLIAVADAAGGEWPEIARAACIELCRAADDRTASLGIRLLSDTRKVFEEADALYTDTILNRLIDGDNLDADAPWGDLRGKPIGQRGLARMLSGYGIKPWKVRESGGPPKQGYRREDLWDAWERYLPSPVPANPEHPEQAVQPSPCAASNVPDRTSVPEHISRTEQFEPVTARLVPDVPDVPLLHDTERSCLKCAGEGNCKWCEG